MSALDYLASLLAPAAYEGAKAIPSTSGMDAVLARMQSRWKARQDGAVPESRQLKAVQRFCDTEQVESFLDAYLLSWGLCLPPHPGAECILEDRSRLECVLKGVDNWALHKPSMFRRCYRGLTKNYFNYDVFDDKTPLTGRKNWKLLRDYLQERNGSIKSSGTDPDWVDAAVNNKQLFGEYPCAPYVESLLRGDSTVLPTLYEQLKIEDASWFPRELILAQVRVAAEKGDKEFCNVLPQLLEAVAAKKSLHNEGLTLLLNRYAEIRGAAMHEGLREYAFAWWGNPWLPTNQAKWGFVTDRARDMVTEWLKREFVETFFMKLAEDGMGDPRRMNFWLRYVKSMDPIEIALGSFARNSRERDFVALREKMNGFRRVLDASGANNAFIMTMGDVVVVEFSNLGNALYGYDRREAMPFDTRKPLQLAVGAMNSLKHKGQNNALWLSHQDGQHGWTRWEDMFEATLKQHFGISPDSDIKPSPSARARTSAPPSRPPSHPAASTTDSESIYSNMSYSRHALDLFARARGLIIEDKTAQGGNLWVRTGDGNSAVNAVLTRWGFSLKTDKGWWR
ncbi:EH signature domain-containing protein [Cupriavidus plantarum]|uniref:EH signature protein n=1 Tax=Cupriavidus plantarum TaxID=942865 RepID=A0A316F1R1_9BURK|nr:EH signature domain-containing protein [Cupriavidus plantarum]PWK37668.1 EH signature protein [Cupriavidus plantarum]